MLSLKKMISLRWLLPEQVQDFYPTPSTLSTVMYYTGLDPRTMEKVYVPTDPHEKAMQRALIQYRNPKNYYLVRQALLIAHREDLIGSGPKCLIRAVPPKRPVAAGNASRTLGGQRTSSGPLDNNRSANNSIAKRGRPAAAGNTSRAPGGQRTSSNALHRNHSSKKTSPKSVQRRRK